jgi:CPA1 family monovalent cation:H+ antiporter
MTFFQLATLFIALVAAGGWLNARTLRLPHGVAMLLVGLFGAVGLAAAGRFAPTATVAQGVIGSIQQMDFSQTVLGYLLGFLLFAGAMQVDLSELARRRNAVFWLATIGVLVSTVLVGVGVWLAARWLGYSLPLPWALVFGALISPTDPVAVLATLRRGQLSASLRVVLQGEALFNDGVGIVVFSALAAFAAGAAPSPGQAVLQVAMQAAGGLGLGLFAGLVVVRAARAIDDFAIEASLSLALAMGVYAGAQALHLSGPIAAVGAGLLLGDAPGDPTRPRLSGFWTLIDEILNALLFFLLGLELLVVRLDPGEAGLALAATALVVAARVVVVLPWGAYLHFRREERGPPAILVWGGLHGALSVALALSLPPVAAKPLILAITYAVCVFSVAVQGLTFAPLAARLSRSQGPGSGDTALRSPPESA